jgi:hypothetical protein
MSVSSGLDIYLKDHLAGAVVGSELAAKLSADNADGPLGTFLADLSREIERDKETLERMMETLGVQPDSLKQAGAWVVEKASRLMLTDTFHGNADLKLLLQLETLAIGIEGKGDLWRALRTVPKSELEVDVDLDALAGRAHDQRALLEEHRLVAARAALV